MFWRDFRWSPIITARWLLNPNHACSHLAHIFWSSWTSFSCLFLESNLTLHKSNTWYRLWAHIPYLDVVHVFGSNFANLEGWTFAMVIVRRVIDLEDSSIVESKIILFLPTTSLIQDWMCATLLEFSQMLANQHVEVCGCDYPTCTHVVEIN